MNRLFFAIPVVATIASLLPVPGNADPGTVTMTTRQLWDAYHSNRDAFDDQYFGKTLQITGKVGYLRARHVLDIPPEVDLDSTDSSDHFLQCFGTEADESALLKLQRGQTITVIGKYNKKLYNHVCLEGFTIATSKPNAANPPAAEPSPSTKSAPANPPMGEYMVYQSGGPGGFGPRYRFTLMPNGRYHEYDDEIGTYSYNAATRVIVFRTGPMEGYRGLYYTKGRNNDEGKPVIAIDVNGKVPSLTEASNGQYQYAYYRGAAKTP